MEDNKLAYAIPEAVQATGIGRSTLYEEMAAGRLKARKIGKRTVILREDLLNFLRSLALADAPRSPSSGD